MRQVVLDTETTGLEPKQGHRVIEIGCVELVARRYTGNHFHQYLNPDREIDQGALEVHGITNAFLENKPRFEEIVDDFLGFVRGAELIIHNAAFDVGFINHELVLAGAAADGIEELCTILDTLKLARTIHPGQRNTLDALCKRYGIDNSGRQVHGALLDAEILGDVYLAMTGGQATLELESHLHTQLAPFSQDRQAAAGRHTLPVLHATVEELRAHEARLRAIDEASEHGSLWLHTAAAD